MVRYQLDEIPSSIKCSNCGKTSLEVEGSFQQAGNFIIVYYECPDCGHKDKLQCGKPVDIID
ncbi:hypothetical protein HYG87_00215 [Methanobacterium alkalithermotolerans]|uniref:Uncharacterized protein n=1 Tax=Methanobacterium alkalithermotolerans TaxID=2731220 RepID=A0A8T8K326_9EURY|nr:hypothetical protein [Methanobacterium alkalithermotolerans]QUH22299.1 hypothetical protein HYG87_00215 [Methanobacterium alkalithermotolerans]RJS49628.1 MAG: hypothetical protein CIT03_02210 [Methanobacterium sp.]